MGFWAQKSIKLAPGVRMTVTPRGVSLRAGVKVTRVSASSDGRVSRTLSVARKGGSQVTATGRALRPPAAPSAASHAPKPGPAKSSYSGLRESLAALPA
jgi:hypothetical protein